MNFTSTAASLFACGIRLAPHMDAVWETACANALATSREDIARFARQIITGKLAASFAKMNPHAARTEIATRLESAFVLRATVENHATRAFQPLDKSAD